MQETNNGYEDIGFAKIDFDRKNRRKFPEVIFAGGKTDEHLLKIFDLFYQKKENILATRATKAQMDLIKSKYTQVIIDEISSTMRIEFEKKEKRGLISICSGGTSDIAVCEEARITAQFFGANVNTFYDVGVSGIHRLLSKIEEIKKANVIIAVAGMEGALATVIAGLVDKPVICVPTSVGYGANLKGVATLLTMINSCSEGINVVNIDNGYGAAYNAAQINRLIEEARN
ncbi:nickel pincer cofactor biosynthesis protein LarB [Criibacterium bergeronii]|uniref:Nickel pincer cofactor biosynthesis protein LarB n=1 Tax=Criibacterium bergeronii TaxID=1871336 RepID=A0A371IKZ4_9FIRM|nr:nickel pincer cofactor biosynthesis protein LarB [Criibacterium bergeronii]RDY21162.1 nickel pincer cofactor biosynthesis protein LarB [Criibacterium bergeronii]